MVHSICLKFFSLLDEFFFLLNPFSFVQSYTARLQFVKLEVFC